MDRSIEAAVVRMLFAIDRLDWEAIREVLATKVEVDYTSLFAGERECLAADELLERWRSLLPGFDATQHITGPVILSSFERTSAVAHTHVRGYHHLRGVPDGTWMVAGHYVMKLSEENQRWRIGSIVLQAFWQEGNLDAPKIAAARVRAGHVRSLTRP